MFEITTYILDHIGNCRVNFIIEHVSEISLIGVDRCNNAFEVIGIERATEHFTNVDRRAKRTPLAG